MISRMLTIRLFNTAFGLNCFWCPLNMNLTVTFSYALPLFRLFKLKRQVVNGLPLDALRLVKLAYRFVSL